MSPRVTHGGGFESAPPGWLVRVDALEVGQSGAAWRWSVWLVHRDVARWRDVMVLPASVMVLGEVGVVVERLGWGECRTRGAAVRAAEGVVECAPWPFMESR